MRPYSTSDSLDELTDLLHRAYKQLADMGFRFFATHQKPEDTAERIRNAFCWVGELDGRPVATICLYGTSDPESTCKWYRKPGVWKFGQFAVEPALQRSGLGTALMNLVEDYARRSGANEIALDTAEGAHHLINYYSRSGYRLVDHVQWGNTNYRSVIMSKAFAEEV